MIPVSVIIIISAIVLFIGIFVALFYMLANKLKMHEKNLREKFSDRLIFLSSAGANFAGQKSKGLMQVRGNGALLLVEDQIYFKMLVPDREIVIPIDMITGIRKANGFLGKTKGIPLIVVEFTNEENRSDEAGWWVRNVDEWINSINELRNKRNISDEN